MKYTTAGIIHIGYLILKLFKENCSCEVVEEIVKA